MGRPAAGMSRIDEVVQLFLKDAGRVYVHQDANYNVTTLTDITGRVLERYFYSPYGQLEAVISSHPFDFDDDGDVDLDDAWAIDDDCSGGYSGDCRRLDADGDRDIDEDDLDIIAAYIGGLSGDTALTRVPSSPRSRLGNPFAHQGLPLDAEIASYQNRARQYNPGLQRFMQRDPTSNDDELAFELFEEDGVNFYSYVRGNPLSAQDPLGTKTCGGWAPVVAPGWRATKGVRANTNWVQCTWRKCRSFTRGCLNTWPRCNTWTETCLNCCGTAVTTMCWSPPIGGTGGPGLQQYCNSAACTASQPPYPPSSCTPAGAGGCPP